MKLRYRANEEIGDDLISKKKFLPLKQIVIFFIGYTLIFILFSMTLRYTFPFITGFLLALAVQPVIDFLKKRCHLKPGLCSVITTLLIFLILFGLLSLAISHLIGELVFMIQGLNNADLSYITLPLIDFINQIGSALSKIDANFIHQNKQQILSLASSSVSVITAILKGILSFLTSIPAIFTMIIVMIFSTYFFSKDMPYIKNCIKSILKENAITQINHASQHGFSIIGKYTISYLFIYFVTFLESLLVFYIFGIKYPLVLSILTAIADIVPILGPGTIYIPLVGICLFSGNYFSAIGLLISWIIISVVREIIEPKIVASSIQIHPLAMLASIYISLIAGNFSIFVYLTVMFVLYQILKKAQILTPLFPNRPKHVKRRKKQHNFIKNAV